MGQDIRLFCFEATNRFGVGSASSANTFAAYASHQQFEEQRSAKLAISVPPESTN